LANEIGVAHRALYNHFTDKDALLAAVAAMGFGELADSLKQTSSAAEHLRSYATFALGHRHLYATMMNRTYRQFEEEPELRAAADRVIAASISVLAPNHANDDDRRREVMRHWMLVHGGVSLHASGVLKKRSDEDFIEELLAITGLGSPPASEPQQIWKTPEEPQS
jgi:AcrR family transcriptional regulator